MVLLGILHAEALDIDEAFIPINSTVVIISGLPGDLESETSFRDQLQSLIEIVDSSGRARNVFILTDDPAGVTLTAPPGQGSTNAPVITKLKSDRSGFVGLGKSLSTKLNPVVVIAFGHGGKQGNSPVFHVRGPRLTPGDFEKLAAELGEVASRWVLEFRGSGAFAAKLAQEGRFILSSESETMFGSDPIAMPLLLKILKAELGISFQALGEQVGRATTAWYEERHLARTEEPALWLGKSKPLLLAKAENSLGSLKPEEPVPREANEARKVPTRPKDLPASWKDIKRVEPAGFPDTDAVVLRRRFNYTLGSSPAISSEHDEFLQVLNLEGKRFGDFDVCYSPPFEDITFLDCEVLRPNGDFVRLDPDAIREAREESVADYHTGRRKFFSLPGVAPGAILHVRYRTVWKEFPLPHVSLEIPIERELPVQDLTVQITVPKNSAFHFAFDNPDLLEAPTSTPASDPIIKQGSYGIAYSWHFENLRSRPAEMLSPPRLDSRLMLSTFADWAQFSEWFRRISRQTDEITPEISTKAADLARGAGTEREKVLALYNYVASLRYVAVPLGVNSFRPHAAANVFQNQFGDCKDKANLFDTLLHSLKIPAELVLVPRFSQAHESIPGLAFNHAISRVTLPTETLWVDTTDDVCRFGMLPPGDSGRNVLVIAEGTNALTQLPKPNAAEHLLKLNGELRSASEEDALAVTWAATASGYPDYELRSTARGTKAHSYSLPLLASRFRPSAGLFALESQTNTSVAALDEDFSWQAKGTCVGCLSGRTLRAPFWLPKEWDVALHHRSSPLFLNQGYPLTLHEDLNFSLPAAWHSLDLPANAENKLPPLRWRVEWAKVADAKVSAKLRVELVQGELDSADSLRFQQQLQALVSAVSASASLAR